jgi:hypothetical protein
MKVIVQHGERLERGHGDVAHGSELRGVGAIERIHEWVGQRAEHKAIDAATIIRGVVGVERA